MYLMIENVNEAPLESFTVFGASTRRGESGSIGQFGSGAKFGTLVCMRFGLNPTIYSGRDRIEFFSEPMSMAGKNFSRVCYKHKSKTERTSYTLEFGELDWDDCKMGLREYVSNAIDGANGNIKQVNIKTVDKPRAKSGYTRIFVPLTPEVQNFYSDLPNRFLHFGSVGNKRGLLEKRQEGGAIVYLKGVMVRQVENSKSLFDYNFGDELAIDESRNLSDYSVRYAAQRAIGSLQDVDKIEKIVDAISKQDKFWENDFGGLTVEYAARNNAKLWKDAFHKIHGDNAVICSKEHLTFLKKLEGKGFKPVLITYDGWVQVLKGCGIQTVIDVLDDVNDDGFVIREATDETMKVAKRVWGWLESVDMTKGKPFPEVKEFISHMDGGATTGGYYKNGIVYIEKEWIGNNKVMLEEMAHYVTGSTDNSRDFQDFAFKFGAILGEILA